MNDQEKRKGSVSMKEDREEATNKCDLIDIEELDISGDSSLLNDELVCDTFLKDDLKDFISDEVINDSFLHKDNDTRPFRSEVEVFSHKSISGSNSFEISSDTLNSVIGLEKRTDSIKEQISSSSHCLQASLTSEKKPGFDTTTSQNQEDTSISSSSLNLPSLCNDSESNSFEQKLSDVNVQASLNSDCIKKNVQCADLDKNCENIEKSVVASKADTRLCQNHENNDVGQTYLEKLCQNLGKIEESFNSAECISNSSNSDQEQSHCTNLKETILTDNISKELTITHSSNTEHIISHSTVAEENGLHCSTILDHFAENETKPKSSTEINIEGSFSDQSVQDASSVKNEQLHPVTVEAKLPNSTISQTDELCTNLDGKEGLNEKEIALGCVIPDDSKSLEELNSDTSRPTDLKNKFIEEHEPNLNINFYPSEEININQNVEIFGKNYSKCIPSDDSDNICNNIETNETSCSNFKEDNSTSGEANSILQCIHSEKNSAGTINSKEKVNHYMDTLFNNMENRNIFEGDADSKEVITQTNEFEECMHASILEKMDIDCDNLKDTNVNTIYTGSKRIDKHFEKLKKSGVQNNLENADNCIKFLEENFKNNTDSKASCSNYVDLKKKEQEDFISHESSIQCSISEETDANVANLEKLYEKPVISKEDNENFISHAEETNVNSIALEENTIKFSNIGKKSGNCTNSEDIIECAKPEVNSKLSVWQGTNVNCVNLEETNEKFLSLNENEIEHQKLEETDEESNTKMNLQLCESEDLQSMNSKETSTKSTISSKTDSCIEEGLSLDFCKSSSLRETLQTEEIKNTNIISGNLDDETQQDNLSLSNNLNQNLEESVDKTLLSEDIKILNKDLDLLSVENGNKKTKEENLNSFKKDPSNKSNPILKKLVVCVNKVTDLDKHANSWKKSSTINTLNTKHDTHNDKETLITGVSSSSSQLMEPQNSMDCCTNDPTAKEPVTLASESSSKFSTIVTEDLTHKSDEGIEQSQIIEETKNGLKDAEIGSEKLDLSLSIDEKRNNQDSLESRLKSEEIESKPLLPVLYKAKRGRPRLNKTPKLVVVNSTPRKRGRPRKYFHNTNTSPNDADKELSSKVFLENQSTEESNNVNSQDIMQTLLHKNLPDQHVNTSGFVRKRGRPPKYFSANKNNFVTEQKAVNNDDDKELLSEKALIKTNSTQDLYSNVDSKEDSFKLQKSWDSISTESSLGNASGDNVNIEKSKEDFDKILEQPSISGIKLKSSNKTKLASKKKIKVLLKLSPKRNVHCNFSSITHAKIKSSVEKPTSFSSSLDRDSLQINNEQFKKTLTGEDKDFSVTTPQLNESIVKENLNALKSKEQNLGDEKQKSDIDTLLENSIGLAKNDNNSNVNDVHTDNSNILRNDSILENNDKHSEEENKEMKSSENTEWKREGIKPTEVAEPKRISNSEPLHRIRRRSSSKLSLRLKQEVQEQCCGHWFPNTKSFIRHLIENSKTKNDSLHTAKLVDLGMHKCPLCTEVIWLSLLNMKKHQKTLHDTTKLPPETSSHIKPTIASSTINNTIPEVSESQASVDSNDSSQSKEVNKLFKSGPKSRRRQRLFRQYVEKPCPMSKKKKVMAFQNSTRILCDLSEDPLSSLPSLTVYSIEDLPSHYRPHIQIPKHRIRKKRIKIKPKEPSPDLDNETLLSIKRKLQCLRDSEVSCGNVSDVEKNSDKSTSKVKSIDSKQDACISSETSENEKPKIKNMDTSKSKKVSKVIQKTPLNKVSNCKLQKRVPIDSSNAKKSSNKSFHLKLQKQSHSNSPSSKILLNKSSNLKSRKQALSESNKTPINKSNNLKFQKQSESLSDKTSSNKQSSLKSQKHNDSESLADKSMDEEYKKENTKPKSATEKSDNYQDENRNSRRCSTDSIPIKKSSKKRRSRYSFDPDFMSATPLGRIRIRGRRKRGRPRKKLHGVASSETSDVSSESDSTISDFERKFLDDDDWKENEENIPTVELDLFTLSSFNEDVSVLLVDPKNPDFKVYASMDAIFVGDSALGDVTNQIGYISDNNNVVYVNPSHFLFPKIGAEKEEQVLKSKKTLRSLRCRLKEKEDLKSDSSTQKPVKILKKAALLSITKDLESIVPPISSLEKDKKFEVEVKEASSTESAKSTEEDLQSTNPKVLAANETSSSPLTVRTEEQNPSETSQEITVDEKEDIKSFENEAEPTHDETTEKPQLSEQEGEKPKKLIVSSGMAKSESTQVIEHTHNNTKVIIIKTSVKKSNEKLPKQTSDSIIENIDINEKPKSMAPHIISLEEAVISSSNSLLEKSNQEKVIKTLTVNSVTNKGSDLKKNVSYKVLADSQNPIIPANIDYSSLDTIDVIDYDLVDKNEESYSSNTNESTEMPKENEQTSVHSSNTLSPKKTPILPEPKALTPVKIASKSRVVVASAEIIPFGTIEDGVCLEEILPEIDDEEDEDIEKMLSSLASINKDVNEKFKGEINKEKRLSLLSEIISEKSVELENDSLNSLSDLEISSKDSEISTDNYTIGDINDIVQGNNLWSTPLLPISEKLIEKADLDENKFNLGSNSMIDSKQQLVPQTDERKHSPQVPQKNLDKLNLPTTKESPKKPKRRRKLQGQLNVSSKIPPKSPKIIFSSKKQRKSNYKSGTTKGLSKQSQTAEKPVESSTFQEVSQKIDQKNFRALTDEKDVGRQEETNLKEIKNTSIDDNVFHSLPSLQNPLHVEDLSAKKHRKRKKRRRKPKQAIIQEKHPFNDDVCKDTSTQNAPEVLKMRILLKDLPITLSEDDMDSFRKKGSSYKRKKKKKKHSKKKRKEREELESSISLFKKKKSSPEHILNSPVKQEPDTEAFEQFKVKKELESESDKEICVDDVGSYNRVEAGREECSEKEKLYIEEEKLTQKEEQGSVKKKTPVKKLVLKQFESFRVVELKNPIDDNLSDSIEASDNDSFNVSCESGMDLTLMKIKVREEMQKPKAVKTSSHASTSNHTENTIDELSPEKSFSFSSGGESICIKKETVDGSKTLEEFDLAIKQEPGVFSPSSEEANSSKPKTNEDRSWHSRGAKLKAKIMITDHQKGISNSSVYENSPFKDNSKISSVYENSPFKDNSKISSTPKSKKKSGDTKDIRYYFSSPQNVLKKDSSFSSHPDSETLKDTPEGKSVSSSSPSSFKRSKSFEAHSNPPKKKTAKSSNNTQPSPSTSTVLTPSSQKGKKRSRTLKQNMDIRQFLDITSPSSLKNGNQKKPPISSSSSPPPEKKFKLDIVKREPSDSETPDFEGFDNEKNLTGLRLQILQDYVDVLNTNTLFDTEIFPIPLDQLCDWNDDLLQQILFEKG